MDLDGRDWYYYFDSSGESSSEERYINEWESKINSDGSLFFVKQYPPRDDTRADCKRIVPNQSNPCDKSTGILGKFMRRRNSRRSSRRAENKRSSRKDPNINQEEAAKGDKKEQESEASQTYVRISIDYNSATSGITVESLFGLKTANRNSAVTITGFSSSKAPSFDSRVSPGDRLISVNGTLITSHNLDEVLLGLETCGEVVLGFQKSRKNPVEAELSSFCTIRSNEKGYSTENGSVLYAKYEGLTEAGPADQGILYSFPKKGNILAQIRGAFFTLSHLLTTVSSSPPRSTTMKLDNNYFNIFYVHEKSEVLLISFPNSKYFLEESIKVVNSVARCLEFMFQSLTRCFSNKNNVDFLDSFFYKLLLKTKVEEMMNYPTWEFETFLPPPCSFQLPKDVYMQIDDALNELESNYIPSQEGQRLFTIIGSCYFYKGYLICNHLSNKDLLDISALIKENEILKLCKEGVKDLVYWKEVYPLSSQRGMTSPCSVPYSTPVGKWFLLIVGMEHCFLATLLEAGGCTIRVSMNKGPSKVYVEETQATLRHIMKIDFPPQINKQLNIHSDFTEDFREQTKSASTDSSSSISSCADLQSQNKHLATEVHRSYNLTGFRGRPSFENIRTVGSYGDVDYGPEEEFVPVLGRRAERELALETNSQSRISVSDSISDDSDWLKDYKPNNRNCTFDMNDITKSIPVEDDVTSPRYLMENDNLLIHFINFEASEGILISSIVKSEKSSKYLQILQSFRQHAHKIQKIFLSTILFKKPKSQEVTEVLNKSLVAVNEYGMLFQYVDDNKRDIESYWVVGKLFFIPHPREVYVCFLDTCPQNMVEIAFQLALSSVR